MMGWEGLDEIVAIVDCGSFAAAAKALDRSTSHVSRAIAQLERRLSVQLLSRTTRRVTATPEGAALVEQMRRVLQERDDALASLGGGEIQGELRITCPTALGERFVAPLARAYALDHPAVSIRLELSNRIVDLIGEGFDIAVRTGQIRDTRLVAHRIGSRRLALCAAPAYLQQHGTPTSIEELRGHECLVGAREEWLFGTGMDQRSILPKGHWRCNSGDALADAALAGMGICQIPLFYVDRHLQSGTLIRIMRSFEGKDEAVWAVTPQRRSLLRKVRQFIDLLARDLPEAMVPAYC
ncbi:MAG: LysR family transcriptional regulator [Lysobacteraceae bacterium]|nr:MAG: LysR family transcriptional regulator [Xanthomonadaceae bacterium]